MIIKRRDDTIAEMCAVRKPGGKSFAAAAVVREAKDGFDLRVVQLGGSPRRPLRVLADRSAVAAENVLATARSFVGGSIALLLDRPHEDRVSIRCLARLEHDAATRGEFIELPGSRLYDCI